MSRRQDTFKAVLADLPFLDCTNNRDLINWLRRLFELVDAAENNIIPQRKEIAAAIMRVRSERPNKRLPQVSSDRRRGQETYAKWIITYTLNVLAMTPAQIEKDEDAPPFYIAIEARRFLGLQPSW